MYITGMGPLNIVDFCCKNQVLVKDNYGNTKKVHVKDVKPVEMDIATAEFFRKEREQCTTRDAKHVMPIKLIPDLDWEFIENINVMESDKGVTIYCVKETEDENKATQVTEVSEPEIDVKTTENIEPVVTEAVETPEDTQTTEVTKPIKDTNVAETEEPRYEHRESLETATEDTVPRENLEILKDAGPRYEHREHLETATEDAVPREIMKEAEPTENTGISQAVLVDPAEDTETTEVSKQAMSEKIEVTDTIEIAEVATDIPELIVAVTPRENEESKNCSTITTTPPESPQRENPKVKNNSEDITEEIAETEQAVKKTHKYPETNNSLVNKILSVFRQAKESNPQPAPEYGSQM